MKDKTLRQYLRAKGVIHEINGFLYNPARFFDGKWVTDNISDRVSNIENDFKNLKDEFNEFKRIQEIDNKDIRDRLIELLRCLKKSDLVQNDAFGNLIASCNKSIFRYIEDRIEEKEKTMLSYRDMLFQIAEHLKMSWELCTSDWMLKPKTKKDKD